MSVLDSVVKPTCLATFTAIGRRRRYAFSVATLASLGLAACANASDEEDTLTAVAPLEARACNSEEMFQLLRQIPDTYDVKCSFTLPAGSTVYRPLRFYGDAADGVTVDCNGSTIGHAGYWVPDGYTGSVDSDDVALKMKLIEDTKGGEVIEIRSKLKTSGDSVVKKSDGYYESQRPEQITIKNCHIRGTVRVWGLGKNGQAEYVRQSSIDTSAPKHPARARDAAPRDIVFDNVTIDAEGSKHVYVSPGVTRFQLLNSTLKGKSTGMALYLDTESQYNTLRNNHFTVDTYSDHDGLVREIISVDGSSGNLIVDNRFDHVDSGGIFLYRNCGEGGAVRWTGPERNRIINNYFYYDKYEGSNPSVFVGSRDESPSGRHCSEDSAYDFGSGRSDFDYARYNVVMQNQVRHRTVGESFVVQHTAINSPSYLGYNQVVSERINRKAGCYLPTGFSNDFILDGQTAAVVETRPGGDGYIVQRCSDGILWDDSYLPMTTVPFSCSASNNDAGCTVTASCPSGKRVVGAKAICDLENSHVTAAELNAVSAGLVDVATLSDNSSDGKCTVGNTTVVSREDVIRGAAGATKLTAHCQENDSKDGGDCAVRGILYCN